MCVTFPAEKEILLPKGCTLKLGIMMECTAGITPDFNSVYAPTVTVIVGVGWRPKKSAPILHISNVEVPRLQMITLTSTGYRCDTIDLARNVIVRVNNVKWILTNSSSI